VATNVEIKARVDDWSALKELAERFSDGPGEEIAQQDVFFGVLRGRLKLRILGPGSGQLVYYERQDGTGPRLSRYLISTTTEPDVLREVLAACLGVRGMVIKTRLLYLAGNTRIHLDTVEGLGHFLELEVVLRSDQSMEDGQATARQWMAKLGVEESQLVDVAYIDLLEQQAHPYAPDRGMGMPLLR
jgi:predicted adenylyl cyclase CyaB